MRIGLRILKPETCVEASRPLGRPPAAAAAVEPKSVQLQMMVSVTQAARAR